MTRIAINAHILYHIKSGQSRYAIQLRDALVADGDKLIELKLPRIFYRKGKVVQYMRFIALLVLEILVPPLFILFRAADLHISPSFTAPFGLFSRKYIVVFYDMSFADLPQYYPRREHLYFWLCLKILKLGSHRIVMTAQYGKEDFCRRTGISPDRVSVIPPYSEMPKIANADKEKYFVLLSNAHPRKNIESTVRGFLASNAPKCGYKLYVVGSFVTPIAYASPDIVVSANLSDKDLAAMIQRAAAMLLFSFNEGFGYPVVEAAQFGTVSMTSEVTSLREFVHPGREPQPALIAEEIAARIDLYLTDENYRSVLDMDREYTAMTFTKAAFRDAWRQMIAV